MNELELVRDACAAVPGPNEDATAAARAALRREIDEFNAERAPRRRGRRAYVLGASLAVALAALLAVVGSSRHGPLGVRVAAAADSALSPSNGDIVHAISRTTVTFETAARTSRTSSSDELWSTNRPPLANVNRYGIGTAYSFIVLTTPCGQISYEPSANLFTVSPYPIAAQFFRRDPLTAYHAARRGGHVHFSGATSFHGIPAFKLVVTQPGSVTTYIVRKNGFPLATLERRVTARLTRTSVTTYSVFEHLHRTPKTERLLHITPHPGAFYIRSSPAARDGTCRRFGNFESLIRRRQP